MKCEATIKVFGDRELVYRSFAAEGKSMSYERSGCKLKKEGRAVVFEVTATDAVAFRAATSGITKMLAVIEKTKGI